MSNKWIVAASIAVIFVDGTRVLAEEKKENGGQNFLSVIKKQKNEPGEQIEPKADDQGKSEDPADHEADKRPKKKKKKKSKEKKHETDQSQVEQKHPEQIAEPVTREEQKETGENKSSKSGPYHLFRPVPRDKMRELTTDRPDKTESPITVDAGHFQIETDVVTVVIDKSVTVDGASGLITSETKKNTVSYNVANLKLGLTDWSDLQLVVASYVVSTEKTDGTETSNKGLGDTTVRWKFNLIGNDGGPVAVGLMPFVKIPTNQGNLGNKKIEGGVIFPFSMELPAGLAMGSMFQWNRMKNETDDSYHNDVIASLTVGHDIIGDLGGYAEFFNQSGDSVDSKWISTVDFGLTWGVTKAVQLDMGVNIGVSDAADDFNPFFGISAKL